MGDYLTLITVGDLANLINADEVVVVDCRFFFEDVAAGRRSYLVGHIPTAVYADLEEDLCSLPVSDHGRHPLPSIDTMTILFQRLGISNHLQVVTYDNADGAAAARLWWMLRYMGHRKVAVLDGGLPSWISAGLPLVEGMETNSPGNFHEQVQRNMLALMSEVDQTRLLVDSRSPERYRGEMEPIDPVAGHIPGAVNFHFQRVFTPEGQFLSAETLRQSFATLLQSTPPAETTFYCGSGVTACNNLLAMAHAGLGMGRLYVGSWSEWCREEGNPIARS